MRWERTKQIVGQSTGLYTLYQNRDATQLRQTLARYSLSLQDFIETFGTRHQNAFHKWITRELFYQCSASEQCSTVFKQLTTFDPRHRRNPDPRIHLRYALTQFLKLTTLIEMIVADAFTGTVSDDVLGCNLQNPNFLGSLVCNGLYNWLNVRNMDYRTFLQFVLAICVKIDIVSLEEEVFRVNNTGGRISRSQMVVFENLTEVESYVQSSFDVRSIEFQRALVIFRSLLSSELDYVTYISAAWNGRSFNELYMIPDDNLAETMSTNNDLPNEIQLVDYSDYTPPVQRGASNMELYNTFFERACVATPDQLNALRRIVASFGAAMTLRVPQEILETRDGICQWLKEEQESTTQECTNTIEPFTQADVSEIPLLFLWKHRTSSNHVQCYDLLYLRDHIQISRTNPLTREPLNDQEINRINAQYAFITGLMQVVLSI